MNPRVRSAAGLVVLAAAAWLLFAVFGGEPAAAPRTAFTSSTQCRECHPAVFAEWEGSQHAMAWINPFVRELSNDFANEDCIDCHAPRPVFETGVGERVLPRAVRRSEGVDCIACHAIPEDQGGGVAGTFDDPTAACRPVARVELQRPELCAGCHDQHQTVQQWRASKASAAGQDCIACHMPYRDGDPDKGRDHRMLGGNDVSMLRRAVELRGRRAGDAFVVEVENVGAGHSFPTDERSRAADVFWRPLAANGEERGPWRHLWRFRSPYRDEVELEDTLLVVDTTWTGAIPLAEADGPVEVALFYKRSPYWLEREHPDPDREATLVHRIELEP